MMSLCPSSLLCDSGVGLSMCRTSLSSLCRQRRCSHCSPQAQKVVQLSSHCSFVFGWAALSKSQLSAMGIQTPVFKRLKSSGELFGYPGILQDNIRPTGTSMCRNCILSASCLQGHPQSVEPSNTKAEQSSVLRLTWLLCGLWRECCQAVRQSPLLL